MVPQIVFLTSYPPRECGIATFSQDLIHAIDRHFCQSFDLKVAALETEARLSYPKEVGYSLNPVDPASYRQFVKTINRNPAVELVVVQHEFGLYHQAPDEFTNMLRELTKPVIVVFHTVLPGPDADLKKRVQEILQNCSGVVVMTENAKKLLVETYDANPAAITVIPHGTHLVPHTDKDALKEKYGFTGRKILSTFGLISSGKNIETTLQALPAIAEQHPDVLFLVIGKTHPVVVQNEGEQYRESLQQLIADLGIERHVQFVNEYVSLKDLLEYLQLTDVYLFTSKDPNQAVSGTFSYALSCGCPIVSTPIPHAVEMLGNDERVLIPFSDPAKLSEKVNRILSDDRFREELSLNGLHRVAPTSWENVAVAYALLMRKKAANKAPLEYRLPVINLHQIKQLTTETGMIQFSVLNKPDIGSGYTLDDNARALIAVCKHYAIKKDESDLSLITTYVSFIEHCQQPQGYFYNYVDAGKRFTDQNFTTNLSDPNGRAIWALGHVLAMKASLPEKLVSRAEKMIKAVLPHIPGMHSTRTMGFVIKGLSLCHQASPDAGYDRFVLLLADRLMQMYLHESDREWEWFESYLTYANGLLPEAMLAAYETTGKAAYREIAEKSFDFLLAQTFHDYGIRVISNRGWMHKGQAREHFGEQPIDVTYTILALSRFYRVLRREDYLAKLETAFNWFLGHNHLHRILYNPATGGCYDGLEEHHVNLNQGAESTVSYLLARLTIEQHKGELLHLHQSLESQRTTRRTQVAERQHAGTSNRPATRAVEALKPYTAKRI